MYTAFITSVRDEPACPGGFMAEIKACVPFSPAEGTVILGHYSYHLRPERASAVNSAWILTGEVLSVGAS